MPTWTPSPFLVETVAAVLERVVAQEMGDDATNAEGAYQRMAQEVLGELHAGLPDPHDQDHVLTDDEVHRITFGYDPSGMCSADVMRLYNSHEVLRRCLAEADQAAVELKAIDVPVPAQEREDVRWIIGYLATHVRGDLLIPARLRPLVLAARLDLDMARFTVAVPITATDPRHTDPIIHDTSPMASMVDPTTPPTDSTEEAAALRWLVGYLANKLAAAGTGVHVPTEMAPYVQACRAETTNTQGLDYGGTLLSETGPASDVVG